MKKCIYCAITGNYDDIKEPTIITPGWDYICFTNTPNLKSKNWKIRVINDKDFSDSRLARKIWSLNHKYVGDYDISILIGGQMKPTCDLDIFLNKFLPVDEKVDMSMPAHPIRNCIYEEANKCIVKKLDDPEIIKRQMDFYKKEGYPKNNGLVAGGIIIRKHNRSNVEEHCEKWWDQIKKWSLRNQLSFDYILWKYNLVNIKYFSYDIVRNKGGYFKKYLHREVKKNEF